MKMKRAVILCLSVLISLVLLAKCDDEGTLNTNNEGYNDVDNDFGSFDETELDTGERDFVGNEVTGGGLVKNNDNDGNKTSVICYVCRAVIEVMLYEVKKINPRKRIDVTATKSIQYSKSETYLSELMEDLCEYADTFAILRQVLVQKTFIQSMLDNGGSVDATPGFSQEALSTENVNFLCLQVLGENDDAILAEFVKEVLPDNIDEIICTERAKYCEVKKTEVDKEHDEL